MRLSKEFRYRSPRPKLFNGDVSMPLSTNQSPSCNWKRQRLVRSEDSRLNYRRNTIYWKLSLGHSRGYILDIPPKKENMLTICKEKLGVANWGWRVGGAPSLLPSTIPLRSASAMQRFKMYKPELLSRENVNKIDWAIKE